MTDIQWTYGSGGHCGPQFAATMEKMRADIERLGMRGALEEWHRTGWLGPVFKEVLTEEDIQRMALAAGQTL